MHHENKNYTIKYLNLKMKWKNSKLNSEKNININKYQYLPKIISLMVQNNSDMACSDKFA